MAHFINDGYNKTVQLETHCGKVVVCFRESLPAKRLAFFDVVKTFSEDSLAKIVTDQVAKQIIYFELNGVLTKFDRNTFPTEDQQSQDLMVTILDTIFGVGNHKERRNEEQNLHDGVILDLTYPAFRENSCEKCRKFLIDPREPMEDRHRTMLRSKGGAVLCETEEGCPAGTEKSPKRLSSKNRLAYNHWKKCRLTSFPDDEIVRRNAQIIETAYQNAGRK